MAEMFGYLQMRSLIPVFCETTILDDFVTEMSQRMVLALDCAELPRVTGDSAKLGNVFNNWCVECQDITDKGRSLIHLIEE